MKPLLIVTALFEVAVGLALLVTPVATVLLLVGVPLDTLLGVGAARVAGAGLVALGVACWRAQNGARGRAPTGVVSTMLGYNAAAAAVLMYAGLHLKVHGALLWPAVVGHQLLAVWCVASLWIERRKRLEPAPR